MDVSPWMDELAQLHERLGGCFLCKELGGRALAYLKGLLGPSERISERHGAEPSPSLIRAPAQSLDSGPVFSEKCSENAQCRIRNLLILNGTERHFFEGFQKGKGSQHLD